MSTYAEKKAPKIHRLKLCCKQTTASKILEFKLIQRQMKTEFRFQSDTWVELLSIAINHCYVPLCLPNSGLPLCLPYLYHCVPHLSLCLLYQCVAHFAHQKKTWILIQTVAMEVMPVHLFLLTHKITVVIEVEPVGLINTFAIRYVYLLFSLS